MNWKYYIPHIWDRPTQIWEDIYLLPDDPEYNGDSIWLTIDALGNVEESTNEESDRAALMEEVLEKLGEKDFYIEETDMTVRVKEFTKEELLEWAKVWLRETRLPVSELIEAPLELFAQTNQHAQLIGDLKANLED